MKKLLHLVIYRESLRGEVDVMTRRSAVLNFWINVSVFSVRKQETTKRIKIFQKQSKN